MPDFRIAEVQDRTRDWEGKNNSAWTSYYVKCEGDERVFEVVKRRNNDGPKVGETIDATVEEREHNGTTYYKLKPVQTGGFGGGGPRQTHPADAARMSRCHSQEMAIRTLELAHSLGIAPEFVASLGADLSNVKGIVGAVTKLADAYDKDVAGAKPA